MSVLLLLLAGVPFTGAVLAAVFSPRGGRFAAAVALLALVVAVGLAAVVAVSAAHGTVATVVLAWVPALGLDLGLRGDLLGAGFALAVQLVGVRLAWLRRSSDASALPPTLPLALLLIGTVQLAMLADNLLVATAASQLAIVAAFFLESRAAPAADACSRLVLHTLSAGTLALLGAVLMFGDTVGGYRSDATLGAAAAVRAQPLFPVMAGLLLAGAWTRSAAWPWGPALAPGLAAALDGGGTAGTLLLLSGFYVMIRLLPLVDGRLPPALIVAGFAAAPVVLAILARLLRASDAAGGERIAAPVPPAARGQR